MDAEEFWQLIERGRASVSSVRQLPNWLTLKLAKMPVDDISDFEVHLRDCHRRSYDARLWAAASVLLKFCSDDAFSDFRGWLIAHGKRVYNHGLEDPDSLADLDLLKNVGERPRLFEMLYVAQEAYGKRIGDKFADIPIDYTKYKNPVLLNQDAWDGDRSKLPTLFPKLCAKHNFQA